VSIMGVTAGEEVSIVGLVMREGIPVSELASVYLLVYLSLAS